MTEERTSPGLQADQGVGAVLRAARLSQGLDLAQLAAHMKVSESKLAALEDERFSDLPDTAFARALASSVCRVLRIDSAPVLAKLPLPAAATLDRVEAGLNAPFRERPGRGAEVIAVPWLRQPVVWLVILLLAGAAAVVLVPTGWLRSLSRASDVAGASVPADGKTTAPQGPGNGPAVEPATQATTSVGDRIEASSTPASVLPEPAAPTNLALQAAPASSSPSTAQTVIRAVESTWVQVTDPRGVILLSRLLAAGEVVGLDQPGPLKVRVGNAKGTQITRLGREVDIASAARDNVANLELQ